MTLTLDQWIAIAASVLPNFIATLSGVLIAFLLSATYDQNKQRAQKKETQIHILKAIRSELDLNLGSMNALAKKDLYVSAVTTFVVDSYQSCVSSGDFSLLRPEMQNTIAFTYLQFKQLDVMSDRLVSALSIPPGQDSTPKLSTIITDFATKQAKSTISLIPEVLTKIDAELERLSEGTQITVEPISEADLLRLIDMVDEQFEHPGIVNRLRILVAEYGLILSGVALMFLAIYFSFLFSQSGAAVPLDTLLLGITLAVVTFSLGVSLALTLDEAERFRHIEGRRHLAALRKKAKDENPLILGVLVRMRVALPPGTYLKGVYDFDKTPFATDKLMLRALDARLV